MEIHDWMTRTTAGDIMVREVKTLKRRDSLAQAAATLLGEQITGAPVVNEAGACIGVLSASDIVAAEQKVAAARQKVAQSSFWNSNLALPVSVYETKLAEVRDKITPATDQPVERFMTADLVSASTDTPLHEVIRAMVDAHVHRVIVLDDVRRVLGIVSTTDILAALLRGGSHT